MNWFITTKVTKVTRRARRKRVTKNTKKNYISSGFSSVPCAPSMVNLRDLRSDIRIFGCGYAALSISWLSLEL